MTIYAIDSDLCLVDANTCHVAVPIAEKTWNWKPICKIWTVEILSSMKLTWISSFV